MRPLKLTLRGINSYRKEQTIDFETLTSAGLFGIFGPTGSGKSSILDAITLALYARLPRSTKNFITINEETAAVSFLFSITTTETHIYRVERAFRYHKGNAGSTVRNTGASLADMTEDQPRILADRPTEVTQECIRLLGLNSDDFMRTVVLPQGQFSEFLKLKNAERRSMLQRIFHLEQYGMDLTQKISSARQKQELLLSNLDGQVQMFENISRETLQELKEKYAALIKSMKKTTEKKEEAARAFQEADAVRSLLIEYEPVRKKYEEALQKMPAMDEKEQRLNLGKRAAQVRPFAAQAEKSKQDAEDAQRTLSQVQRELQTLLSSCRQLQEEKEAAAEAYALHLPTLLQQEQNFLHAIEQSQSIHTWMNRRKETEEQLLDMQKKLSVLNQKEDEFRREENRLQETILSKEQKAAKIKPSREELHGLEQGHILEESYREKRGLYEEARQETQELRRLLEAEQSELSCLTGQLTSMHDTARRYLTIQQEQLAELSVQLAALTKAKVSVQKDTEELQNRHMALTLRSRLKDGDICPVCGGIHHKDHGMHPDKVIAESSPDTAELSDDASVLLQIQHLQSKAEELTRQEKKLEDSRRKTEEQIASASRNLETIHHLLPELSAAFDTDNSASPSGTDDRSAVDSAEIPAAGNFDADTLRLELQNLSTQFLACRERFMQRKEQYDRLLKQNREQYSRLQQSGQEILALRKQWNTENFTETLEAKQAAEKNYDSLQEELHFLRQQMESSRKDREALTAESQALSGQITAARNNITHFRTLIGEAEQKLPGGYSSQTDFSVLLEETKTQRELLERKKDTLEKKYQENAPYH